MNGKLLGALLMAAVASMARAEAAPPAVGADCYIDAAKVAHPPRFADFPAARVALKPGPRRARPPPPMSRPGDPGFETELRRQAAYRPNFAGAFVVAPWSCGTACEGFAIVDARTGRSDIGTVFPGIATDHVKAFAGLRFRRDSRLLIMSGAPQDPETGAEDGGRRAGVYYTVLTGRKLKVIRFVPRALVCSPPGSEERP